MCNEVISRSKQLLLAILILLGTAYSHLCLSAESLPIESRVSIRVEHFRPDSLSLPVGAYLIPRTSIVLYDQTSAPGTLFKSLFGPIGIFAANEAEKTELAKAVPDGNLELIDIDSATMSIIAKEIAAERKYERLSLGVSGEGVRYFVVVPRVWLILNENKQAFVNVAAEAQLREAENKVVWRNTYTAAHSVGRSLQGNDGWFSKGGAPLSSEIARGLEENLRHFVDYAADRLANEGMSASEMATANSIRLASERSQTLADLGGADCTVGETDGEGNAFVQRGRILLNQDNYKAALVCFERVLVLERDTAAFREACSSIGTMYELGWGVTKDLKKAMEWYKKAGM